MAFSVQSFKKLRKFQNGSCCLFRKFSCNSKLYKELQEDKFKSADFDVAVIGGGIIGVTTARELLIQKPELKVVLLEKEPELAMHQTGHNSGVIHSGIYYRPGSLKALLCLAGLHATYAFCNEHNIPYKKCGKVIVAVKESELKTLAYLYKQGVANDVPDLRVLDPEGLKKIEPNCRGIKAIYSPHTGIVDWAVVTKYCAKDFEKRGGTIYCNYEVTHTKDIMFGIEEMMNTKTIYPIIIAGKKGQEISAKYVIACAGLYADRLASMSFGDIDPKIVPFRGEYLLLAKEKCDLIRGNIYPVPDPQLPFLGVHFTPRLDGSVWIGPNAVLAFSREGYKWWNINVKDLFETLSFAGFKVLAKKYKKHGVNEMMNSLFIHRQVEYIQQYIPEIQLKDLRRGLSGVRAQGLYSNGILADGFELNIGTRMAERRILHCRNAPSPSATSCFPIARFIYEHARKAFEWKT